MKTVSELRVEIAALDAELKATIERDSVTAKAAAAAFRFDYDWSIEWPHPAQFRITRTATTATAERLKAFKAEFPAYSYPPKASEGGMTYSVLIGNDGKFYVEGGGGSVIVRPSGKKDGYRSSFDPEPISVEWLEQLRNGIIPEGMKL